MRKFTMVVGFGLMVALATGADSAGCMGGGTSDEPDTGGSVGNPDGGSVANYPKACTADSDCLTAEVCHPIGMVCVKNCKNDATLCGDDFCVETTFGGKTASVCKCETCATGLVCSKDLDDVCETKCTTNTDCNAFTGQNRICGADGVCKFSTSNCSPACTGGQICDEGGAIPLCVDPCTAATCNTATAAKCGTSGLCEACALDADCGNVGTNFKCDKTGTTPTCVSTATTCNSANLAPGTNKGPDTCDYGDVCDSAKNTCSATLPDGSCASGSYQWNEALKGPVIVLLSNPQSFQGSSTPCNGATDKDCCGPATGVTGRGGGMSVDIEFYAPEGMSATGWQAKADTIKFIDSTGAKMSAGHYADYPSAGATYSIKPLHAGVCTKNGATTGIVVDNWSVYLVDSVGSGGNPACL